MRVCDLVSCEVLGLGMIGGLGRKVRPFKTLGLHNLSALWGSNEGGGGGQRNGRVVLGVHAL